MAQGWRLAAAGLAVIAVAGCTHAGSTPAGRTRPVPAAPAAAVRAGAGTRPARTGAATFSLWWAGGGYRQYDRVAMDLKGLIITDALADHDATFTADARRLSVDAAAAEANPPPVGAADYGAAMGDLERAAADALAGSYARAYQGVRAGLTWLGAFTSAAGLTAGSAASS